MDSDKMFALFMVVFVLLSAVGIIALIVRDASIQDKMEQKALSQGCVYVGRPRHMDHHMMACDGVVKVIQGEKQ
jgi:hypothetical protein